MTFGINADTLSLISVWKNATASASDKSLRKFFSNCARWKTRHVSILCSECKRTDACLKQHFCWLVIEIFHASVHHQHKQIENKVRGFPQDIERLHTHTPTETHTHTHTHTHSQTPTSKPKQTKHKLVTNTCRTTKFCSLFDVVLCLPRSRKSWTAKRYPLLQACPPQFSWGG